MPMAEPVILGARRCCDEYAKYDVSNDGFRVPRIPWDQMAILAVNEQG